MFLYLTLYIQDVLGYTPLQAGLRFLPSTLLSFIVAPIAGRLSVRVPVRLLLGSGLVLIGVGLLTMTTIDAASSWTALIPGLRAGRRGRRPRQPAAGLHRGRGGADRAQRHGLGDQLDLPPGWHRHGDRRTGRRVPAQRDPAAPPPRSSPAGTRARVLSTAHGRLGTLLESGEVTQIARSLSPAARTALDHAYRVGFTGRVHDDRRDRRRARARGGRAGLRTRAQPRLRLRRGAARPAGGSEPRSRSRRRG